MSWINFFQNRVEQNHPFGRGTNADIAPDDESLFNKAYKAFAKKNILDAYEFFLNSIQNYTNELPNGNISIDRDKDTLNFELFQGTCRVNGKITQEHFYAEVIIIKKEEANVALKRYILERNYQLTYACYFSDDEYIKLKVFYNNTTMSPQKIFFPIRELALNADFDKEHIRSEFKNITLQDIDHITKIDENQLKIKYKFLHLWIEKLEEKVITLPSNDNTGMQAFLYLNILLKVDYLLVPKYKIYQKLSKKVQDYFGNEHATIEAKNEELRLYVLKLKELSFKEFSTNFYNSKYTFNPIEKSSYDDLVIFINESLNKIKWYKGNRYPQIISIIYQYMAFYSLYNYTINSVIKELLHLLVIVQNSQFFKTLECENFYDAEKKSFFKRAITSKIQDIVSQNQEKYKNLAIFSDDLNFASLDEFSYSYYSMLRNLDFEEL